MKRTFISGLLIAMFVSSYSQNFDVVVTASEDSFAGKINNISDSDPSEFVFKKGNSIIMGRGQPDYPNKYPGKLSLEKASLDELNFYHTKAKRTKKTGAIITILGSGTILTGIALMSTNKEANGYVGFGMTIIGLGITVIWLPVLITGSSRVKTINKIKNSNYSGVTMELGSCSFYNYQAHSHQAGVTFRFKF